MKTIILLIIDFVLKAIIKRNKEEIVDISCSK